MYRISERIIINLRNLSARIHQPQKITILHNVIISVAFSQSFNNQVQAVSWEKSNPDLLEKL